jgi:hypothetical protein
MKSQSPGRHETLRELEGFGVTDDAARSGSEPANASRGWLWSRVTTLSRATAVLSRIGDLARLGARQIATVSLWVAWICPFFLIARLLIEGRTGRLLLWLAGGAVVGILAWAETAGDSDVPRSVYLPAAFSLIAGLVLAARRF